MRKIIFSPDAEEELEFWKKNDPKYLKKIDSLLDSIQKDPFRGIGKPEPLKNELSGFWSRRIDSRHRLVYMVQDNEIFIAQCRHHY